MRIKQIMKNPIRGQKVIIMWKSEKSFGHLIYNCPLVCIHSHDDEGDGEYDTIDPVFWYDDHCEYTSRRMESEFICNHEEISEVLNDPNEGEVSRVIERMKKSINYKIDKAKEKAEAAAQKKEDDAAIALGICH